MPVVSMRRVQVSLVGTSVRNEQTVSFPCHATAVYHCHMNSQIPTVQCCLSSGPTNIPSPISKKISSSVSPTIRVTASSQLLISISLHVHIHFSYATLLYVVKARKIPIARSNVSRIGRASTHLLSLDKLGVSSPAWSSISRRKRSRYVLAWFYTDCVLAWRP